MFLFHIRSIHILRFNYLFLSKRFVSNIKFKEQQSDTSKWAGLSTNFCYTISIEQTLAEYLKCSSHIYSNSIAAIKSSSLKNGCKYTFCLLTWFCHCFSVYPAVFLSSRALETEQGKCRKVPGFMLVWEPLYFL